MYYRVTYKNIGIYEALKNEISFNIWKKLINSDKFTWLPKPPQYYFNYCSYFTEKGFFKFKGLSSFFIKLYIGNSRILYA